MMMPAKPIINNILTKFVWKTFTAILLFHIILVHLGNIVVSAGILIIIAFFTMWEALDGVLMSLTFVVGSRNS